MAIKLILAKGLIIDELAAGLGSYIRRTIAHITPETEIWLSIVLVKLVDIYNRRNRKNLGMRFNHHFRHWKYNFQSNWRKRFWIKTFFYINNYKSRPEVVIQLPSWEYREWLFESTCSDAYNFAFVWEWIFCSVMEYYYFLSSAQVFP